MGTPIGDDADLGTLPAIGPRTRILEADRIAEQGRAEIAPGVTSVQLWSEGRSNAGRMHLEPQAALSEHTHRRHAHHVWVVDGLVEILGRQLARGSYAYVPPGQPHDMAAGPAGATVFYLYLESDDRG
jgi:quercetin dioxygenase-like cupin family protein